MTDRERIDALEMLVVELFKRLEYLEKHRHLKGLTQLVTSPPRYDLKEKSEYTEGQRSYRD